MKNYFKLKFEGLEITLPKSMVKFVGDYGVVEAASIFEFEDGDEVYTTGLGVVNKNYELIIGLIPKIILDKINILPNGLIIYKILNSEAKYDVFLTRYVHGEQVWKNDLASRDYEILSDKTVELKTNVGNYGLQTILHLDSLRVSDYFNYIGDFIFDENLKKEVAEAICLIYDANDFIVDEISCLIDKEGNILNNFYSRSLNYNFEDMNLGQVKELVLKNFGYNSQLK